MFTKQSAANRVDSTQKSFNHKRSVRFFCLSLAVLLVSSVFIWGFQTSWGDIKIQRLTLTGSNGTKISTLIYIPKTATAKTPAPCAIIYHGRSNQAHSNDTWSMELARRGYVVLSPDLSGGGESDIIPNRDDQSIKVAEYANSLDIVIQNQINLIGYSLGCNSVEVVYKTLAQKVNSSLFVFGPFMIDMAAKSMGGTNFLKSMNCDIGIIKAFADQYDHGFLGNSAANIDKMTASFGLNSRIIPGQEMSFNGNKFYYAEISGALHQTGNISGQTVTEILKFEDMVTSAPVKREASDQAWIWQQIFSGVAAITMLFLLAAAIGLLLETPLFRSINNKRPERTAQRGAKAWILDILFTFVIPAILFIPVSAYGMAWFSGKVLTSNNLNGIMLWLVVIAIIVLVRMMIKRSSRIKKGDTILLSDYCLAGEGETHLAKGVIWKSLIIGIGLACFFGLIMTAMESYFGISYQVWNLATYLKPSGARVIKSIPYMIIIFAVMFIGNMNQRTLPSTGNERKDTIIAVAVNSFLTASALFALLLLQYGGSLINGTGAPVFPSMQFPGIPGTGSVGALDFAFGYCYMMGGTTGVVTYIYRKYGNIWAGVIPCSIFAGLFTLISFTLAH